MVVKMEQVQAQTQTLAPQLRQSLKILQVSAMELRDVVMEELQLNPTLEELPPDNVSLEEASEQFTRSNQETMRYGLDRKKHDFLMDSLTAEVSLQDHLFQQIGCMDLSLEIEKVLHFLIGSLDEKGFLTMTADKVVQRIGTSKETIQAAFEILQQLDPIGVGCPDTRTCLLQQLKFQNKENTLAYKIVDQCYDWLLRNRVMDIARYLEISSPETIQNAITEIAKLDPVPGRRFEIHHTQSIIPDVSVYKNRLHEWVVELNNHYIPRLCIGDSYEQLLMRGAMTDQDKAYLQLKLRSGRFLIQSILQRQKTIERIAHAILDKQRDFFEKGPHYLKPLTLQSMAEELGNHETTISRATTHKFMDTPFGVFDFKYFFTKGLNSKSGDIIPSTIIKQKIKEIVEMEDKKKPLSDKRISEILAQKDVIIARRTISKYRELLGIPSTSLRRKYD